VLSFLIKKHIHLFYKKYLPFILLHLVPITFLLTGTSITVGLVYQYETSLQQITCLSWLLLVAFSVLTMSVGVTPTSLVALLSSFLWGYAAIFTVIPSYMAAAWVSYTWSKKIKINEILTNLLAEKTSVIQEKFSQNSLLLVISMRISPIFPFVLTNLWLSLVRVPLQDFLWGSLIGMLPRTLLLIWIGSQAQAIKQAIEAGKNGNEMMQEVSWVLFVFSFAGMGIWFVKNFSRFFKQ
jgi:uncharacterized membrane protein YdjX (TVP38/TMEM64 family)